MDELFKTPEMYYYAQYFLNLICPAGIVPDYGDAHWEANWTHLADAWIKHQEIV
jgi:hypothetical protein